MGFLFAHDSGGMLHVQRDSLTGDTSAAVLTDGERSHMAIKNDVPFLSRFDGLAMSGMQRSRLRFRQVPRHPNSGERDFVFRISRRTLEFVFPGFKAIGRRGLAVFPCPPIRG
jgi:hypothetical protein